MLSRFAIMRHHFGDNKLSNYKLSNYKAPVAQLDRVSVSEAEGRGFDSRRAHQFMIYREYWLLITTTQFLTLPILSV